MIKKCLLNTVDEKNSGEFRSQLISVKLNLSVSLCSFIINYKVALVIR